VVGVLAVALAACGDESGSAAERRPTVVTSLYPLSEIARRVGGDAVEVTDLTPAGSEPHDLELTTDDVDRIQDAGLVLFVGGEFQPSVEDALELRDGPAIDLLDAVGVEDDDPHFWLDPTLLARAVSAVEAALVELAPAQRAAFARGAEAYRRELDDLDGEVAGALASCRRRDLVTAHAAFGHLAERYDLRQRAIAGLSPEAEPDPARLDELADLVDEAGVTTVFTEPLVSAEVAETLARETGVRTAVLNPIEGLTEEELDAGGSYASVMRENLAALQEALGCG
jgi:zinc transport system substrate-binding protein